MPNMFLTLFIIAALISSPAIATSPSQEPPPLSLRQVEQLIEKGIDDEVVAREIRERGLAFRLPMATFEQLVKRGAGEMTRQALMQQEERAAYAAYLNEKQDPQTRLAMGLEFLRRHPQSERAGEVESGNRRATLEIFNNIAYKNFSANPDAASLGRLLAVGSEILSQSPDRAVAAQVTSQLALGTGRGMIGGFYNDLEQSRTYANQALELLKEKTPPPGMTQEEYAKLRDNSLSILYQCQGLYLLRQPNPDAENAIDFLTKAAEIKGGPSANDPNTYWLRALAYDLIYQKLIEEYRAIPKGRRVGKRGQSLCAKITPISNQLVENYARVIGLSGAGASRQLHEEALAALKSFTGADRPCLTGRTELIDELPAEENRFALVIGVEDYLDKRAGKFNYAASDARAMADALERLAGFRKDKIVLLATGEPPERQPLRSVILQQLTNLSDRVSGGNQADQDGFLLIYFAGHSLERGGKSYLLPADALIGNDALLAETAVSAERIKEAIRASDVSQVMFILDAFRQEPLSEAFTRGLTFDTRNQEVAAFATLLATGVGQLAYESQSKKQGFFTAAFIEALKGRAAGAGREITLDQIVKYLQTSVPAEAQRDSGARGEQRPLAIIEGYQSDDLAMAVFDSGAPPAKPDPGALTRAARTIHIRSKTVYLKPKLLEDELLKLPDFKEMGLKITGDPKEADLVMEVTLPFLTWMWTYVVTHQASKTPIANGKIREITAGTASPKLARDLVRSLQELRAPGPPRK